jgi:hypothetical protein
LISEARLGTLPSRRSPPPRRQIEAQTQRPHSAQCRRSTRR